jgi:hypothetical protein
LSHPQFNVIFKTASQLCLSIIVNGGGHGAIQM